MKVGTLTLHIPFNYGNALQMLSLHKYLLEQGYDAEVLNHWHLPNQDEVAWYCNRRKSAKGILGIIVETLCGARVFSQIRKERKIQSWLSRMFRWSSEFGDDKIFPSQDVRHDAIIVGSDQVWNPKYSKSDFYLMESFSDSVKKIAYAASMGGDQFPKDKIAHYSRALNKFAHISTRESSSVRICKEILDVPAVLVCDPVFLHSREEWCRILGVADKKVPRDELMIYLVSPSFNSLRKDVVRIARESGKKINLFSFQWSPLRRPSLRNPLKFIKDVLSQYSTRVAFGRYNIIHHMDATPDEFVRCLAETNGLITDSFHGMVLATIFEKPCNVAIGTDPERKQMSARLLNFTSEFGDPTVVTDSPDLAAMKKLSVSQKLIDLIESSKAWLKDSIND